MNKSAFIVDTFYLMEVIDYIQNKSLPKIIHNINVLSSTSAFSVILTFDEFEAFFFMK